MPEAVGMVIGFVGVPLGVVVVLIIVKMGMILRMRRGPRELRGDWWTEFERHFRLYAATASDSPSSRGRRRK